MTNSNFAIFLFIVDYGNRNFFSLAKDRHSIDTRSAAEGLLVPQKTTLEIRRNFFSSRVVNAWNALPVEIRTASSVNSFKNSYDLYFSTPDQIPDSPIWPTLRVCTFYNHDSTVYIAFFYLHGLFMTPINDQWSWHRDFNLQTNLYICYCIFN